MKIQLLAVLVAMIFVSACGPSGFAATPANLPIVNLTGTQSIESTSVIPSTQPVITTTPFASLGTIALDFVALLCDARWLNGGQHLTTCPAATADHSGGYAEAIDPLSEALPANTPTLLTIPAWNGFAALFLRYPSFRVHSGDRFRATLRCQENVNCDVQFAVEYYDANGKYQSPFLSWQYKSGDPPVTVDSDLSSLAGQTVDFVLTLRPENDTPQQDYSLWIAPHIYRPNP